MIPSKNRRGQSRDSGPVMAGSVRASQLLWAAGPGSIIDLEHVSAVVLGLQHWSYRNPNWDSKEAVVLNEPRLLGIVQHFVHCAEELRLPPVAKEDVFGAQNWKNNVGVPVALMPTWYRCRACNQLGRVDKHNFVFNERTQSVTHETCSKKAHAAAVPARFVVACTNGHMSEFPWTNYAHPNHVCDAPQLYFYEVGASLQTENLIVKCKNCGASRNMSKAFGKQSLISSLQCAGMHPHFLQNLPAQPNCDAQVKTILIGASNGWFPKVISVLALPLTPTPTVDPLDERIREEFSQYPPSLLNLESIRKLQGELSFQVKTPDLAAMPAEELWTRLKAQLKAAEDSKASSNPANAANPADEDFAVKFPEWNSLTSPLLPFKEQEFEAEAVAVPTGFEDFIESVVLVSRLREVRALVGFSRLESMDYDSNQSRLVPLSEPKQTWVPAVEVRGEGIFIKFKEDVIQAWENRAEVKERDARLHQAHINWRAARQLPPDGYPGARCAFIHTFAHIMIRELSLACGYNAASIRERIYASKPDDPDAMAGVLIYTAAPDSDGTLGGLVELGKPENLGGLMREALNRARTCSSDPLCANFDPSQSGALDVHLASCHACSYVSETSCENSNHYLDRALVVETLSSPAAAYFKFQGLL